MRCFLLIFAIATVSSARRVCAPGSYFRTECNKCVCASDGADYICTQKICPSGAYNADGSLKVPLDVAQQIIPDVSEIEIVPVHEVGTARIPNVQVCTPNSFFHIGCNKCKCTAFGETYNCVRKPCPPYQPVYVPNYHHHRAARSAETNFCEPGTIYYEYCNTCRCSSDGKSGACTKMACDKKVFEEDGSLKYPYSELITPIF